jgi:hypothetical protein
MKYKNKIKVYNGIKYKSMLEVTCATLLDQSGISFQYEPYEMVLVHGSKYPGQIYEKQVKKKVRTYGPARGNIRSISYTPDFVGENWIIETKGYETPEFKMKWKLFQHELMKQNKTPHLFKPTNKREIIESINLIKALNVTSNGKKSRKFSKRPKGTSKAR